VPRSVPTSAPFVQNQKPERIQPPPTRSIQPTETVAQPTETVAQPKHDTAVSPTIPDLGDTLVKYNIIPVKINMTAKLNSSVLLINGVKQPEAVRALVYSKFLNDNVHNVDIDYVYKNAQADPSSPYSYPSNRGSYNDQEQQTLDRERQTLEREQQNLDREQANLNRERQYLALNQRYHTEYNSAEASIKVDLMKDGLVSDTNHIHFTINEKEFILNGVTQNPEVHQRYLDKYCPAKGAAGWSWSHSTNRL
jgi:hypothetical protein